jgi:hypothetical protein
MHGVQRWIVVGAVGISGPWTVAVMTILMSGAADSLMGLDAENSTADVLRRFRRQGFKLANGIKIRGKEDIDHLVLSSAGLLVVESKWSRYRWPIGDSNRSFMSDRLLETVEQVLRNTKNVKVQFAEVLEDAPVNAACVVWSAENSSDDPPWVELQGVVVVRGPALSQWLLLQKGEMIDKGAVDRIWKKIDHQAAIRDDDDLKRSGPPRPTVGRMAAELFLAPLLGSMVACYGLIAIGRVHQGWLDVAASVAFFALGILTLKFVPAKVVSFRRAAIGCAALSAVFMLLYLEAIIHNLVK